MSNAVVDVTSGLPLRDSLLLAQYAEARGVEAICIGEQPGRDIAVELAVLALGTERIRIKARLVPGVRNAAALAALEAALCDLAPGRVELEEARGADAQVAGVGAAERTADAIRARLEEAVGADEGL
jgi:Luciferase-like monooxygenase